MQQILTDRTMLRGIRSEAESARNYVETYFCDALLAAISEVLPDDHEPCGLELRSTVMIKAVEAVEEPDETEEFLSRLGELVDALKVWHLDSPTSELHHAGSFRCTCCRGFSAKAEVLPGSYSFAAPCRLCLWMRHNF